MEHVGFGVVQGEDRNFYRESISRNLAYLADLVRQTPVERLERLKRGGIVDRVRVHLDNGGDDVLE